MNRVVGFFAAIGLGILPAAGDQLLGTPRVISGSNAVELPGGPTLGRWQANKYTATPDALALPSTDQGSTGDISSMSVTPDEGKASGTLARTVADLNRGKLSLSGGTLTGPLTAPRATIQGSFTGNQATLFTTVMNESLDAGAGNFVIGNVMLINRNGGTGNREGLHVELNATNGTDHSMMAGGQLAAIIKSGGGLAFGGNTSCIVEAAANASSQCISQEMNTRASRDIVAKVGLQIVDAERSSGRGTTIDAGMLFSQQGSGSVGYARGIQFGYDPANSPLYETTYPVRAGGDLITSLPTNRVLRAGIDLLNIQRPFSEAAIKLASGNKIMFGASGVGGMITSATATNGPNLLFGSDLLVLRNLAENTDYMTVGPTGIAAASFTGKLRSPASRDACTPGQFVDDANYHYVCVAKNSWKRVQLSSY